MLTNHCYMFYNQLNSLGFLVILQSYLSGVRMEEFFYEKVDKKKRDRLTNTETLGQYMIDSGNEFGPGTSYGKQLFSNLEITSLMYHVAYICHENSSSTRVVHAKCS